MLNTVELERFRPLLTGHCYRMLGSVFDADDAVQETLVRAWRSQDGFEGRSAVSSWLYRIATNVCLDFLAERKRRARPIEEGPAGAIGDELVLRPASDWLEPILDQAVVPPHADPHERAVLRESTRLAFVSALQHLPAKQRAALLLTEVVGYSAQEAAECLEMTVPAINSALQRARETVATRAVMKGTLSEGDTRLADRYVEAFEAFDVPALTALLHEDAKFSMPPVALWLSGAADIRRWLESPLGGGCRGSRLLRTSACGSPAFAQYRPRKGGGHAAWGLIVLETEGEQIVGWNTFLGAQALFPRFDFPLELD
jgi:RNA polymerase sigma-70 factor (ECF subfamily)